MFQFAFDRGLLTFRLNTPAFAWLFQLPPRIGSRLKRQIPQKYHFALCCLIHPPKSLPVSVVKRDMIS